MIKPVKKNITLIALSIVLLCLLIGSPHLSDMQNKRNLTARSEHSQITEVAYVANGKYKINHKHLGNSAVKILDPLTLEPLKQQKKYADLLSEFGDFVEIKRTAKELTLPLRSNKFKINKVLLTTDGELYDITNTDKPTRKRLTTFTKAYFVNPELFFHRHILPVKIKKTTSGIEVKRLNAERSEVLIEGGKRKLYLIKLQHPKANEGASLIKNNSIYLPLVDDNIHPEEESRPKQEKSSDAAIVIDQQEMAVMAGDEIICSPCEMESAGFCIPLACPSGRPCVEENGQATCSYCGDGICQADYESCHDCRSDCPSTGAECSGGETPTPTATPAQCSISADPISASEGQDTTINITPSYGSNTDAILSNIEIKSEPKKKDFKNAALEEGKSTEIEFEYFPSENKAVAKNTLWYGYGQGDTLCMEEISNEDQGKYTLTIDATFDDGCKAQTTATLDVSYPSRAGGANDELSFGADFDFVQIESRDLGGGAWYSCGQYRCPADNCLKQDSFVTEEHPQDLQYHTVAMKEENFHVEQGKGNVDWSRGGNIDNGIKVASSSEFIKHFLPEKICAGSITSAQAAWQNASNKAERHLSNVFDYYSIYFQRWIKLKESICWFEYTAKESAEVNLTESYAGFHFDCTYAKDPGCANPPAKPNFFWKWVETQPKLNLPLPKE